MSVLCGSSWFGMRAQQGSAGPRSRRQRWLERRPHTETAVSWKHGRPHGRGVGRGSAPHSHARLSLSQEATGTQQASRDTGHWVPAGGRRGHGTGPTQVKAREGLSRAGPPWPSKEGSKQNSGLAQWR